MTSDVPQERRSGISFSFTCSNPGIYDVAVVYKIKQITTMQVLFFLWICFFYVLNISPFYFLFRFLFCVCFEWIFL